MSLDLVRHPLTPSLGLSLLCGATVGYVIGALAYVGCGALLDTLFVEPLRVPGKPQLSYGQMFGMIMMPLAGLLGAGAGFSIVFAWRRRPIVATIVLFGSVVVSSALTRMLWAQDVAQYGPDLSQIILYVPSALVAAIIFLVSAGWIVVLTVHRP